MTIGFQSTLARVSLEKVLTCRANSERLTVCPKLHSGKRRLEWPFCFKLQIDACDSPDGRTQSTENFRRFFSLAVLRSINLRKNLSVIKSDRAWGKWNPRRMNDPQKWSRVFAVDLTANQRTRLCAFHVRIPEFEYFLMTATAGSGWKWVLFPLNDNKRTVSVLWEAWPTKPC